MKHKKNIIIVLVILLLFVVVSSTYAFWIWRGNVSEVNVTTGIPFNCSADGGVHASTVGLMPASCTHSRYAIQREITVNHQLFSANSIITLDMTLKIEQIGTGLSESSNFKYALTRSPDSCTTDVISTGTFQNATEGTTITILTDEMFTYIGEESVNKYYLYVWIDPAEENSNILNQTFSFSLDLVCNQHKNQEGKLIYNVVTENGVLDNVKSEFVNSSTGINFLSPSGTTNGRGVYIDADTVNDTYPIHYYRGAVDNNNVIFADYCWKILRTTDTRGVKLVYNGVPNNGKCDNLGNASQIASGINYTSASIGLAGAGYSYTDGTSLKMTVKNDSTVTAGTIFSYDISYNETTGKYTLIGDKVTSSSSFTAEKNDLINEHHYTCFKTVDQECSEVYFVYMGRNSQIFYATIKNGLRSITDLLNIEFEGHSTNQTPSTVQNYINTWYANNMAAYTSNLEDTVFCNDRSLYNPWTLTSSIANDDNLKTSFAPKGRVAFTGNPTFECKYEADSFTVSEDNGNGVLPYPIGLVTFDELAMAGVAWWIASSDSYLYSNSVWWTMSPGFISATGIYYGVSYSQLDHVAIDYKGSKKSDGSYAAGGVRPSVSLKYGTRIRGGIGTVNQPYLIEEYVSATHIYDPENISSDKLHIGDFVEYDAGTWTQAEINNIQVGPITAPVGVNNSIALPTLGYQFGGFMVGSSRNSTSLIAQFPDLGTVGYIYNVETNQPIDGWRVYDINEDTGEVTLISAGNPEAFYQVVSDDGGYSTPYIFNGTIDSSWGEANAANYQIRSWEPYVNEDQGATSAYILSKSDLEAWYTKHIGSSGDLWTQSNFQKIYQYPRLHNIIDNYSHWWLASPRAAQGPHFVQGDDGRRLRGGNGVAIGIRVNVVLSNQAKFSSNKVDTIELTSEHLTGYGGNQIYNVWKLQS